jgi:(E)-4-hydroxy-3-methylbut-2-enyl-diphosphate synthase
MFSVAAEVERRLAELDGAPDMTVAVMGCAVNGPGEARGADFGVAGGDGEGVLFRRGEIVGKARADELAERLFDLIRAG